MPSVNCTTAIMTATKADELQQHLADSGYRLRSRVVRTVAGLCAVMRSATRRPEPVAFALSNEIFGVWERWGDSVGAAFIVVESQIAALIVTVDGRDPLAGLTTGQCLHNLGFDSFPIPPIDSDQHGLIVITNPSASNEVVSILPVALVFPAFSETRGLPD